ncbi:MAG: hypothetical protein ACJ74U_02540 [Jatrophihabitantaceae bacterium]
MVTHDTHPLSPTDELAWLRSRVAEQDAELDRLRGEADTAPGGPARATGPSKPVGQVRRERLRSATAIALITLACVLAPLAVVAKWAKSEISNTDRYVQTVAPLASNPDIQRAITDNVTTAIFNYVDVQGLTDQAVTALGTLDLPPLVVRQLQGLGTPLANGIESFVHGQIGKIVASPAFENAWNEANRTAHAELVNLMSGQTSNGGITAENGIVSIHLGPFIDQVKAQLSAQGLSIVDNIPHINPSFVLFESKDVTKAQRAYRMLNNLGTWLPVIALVLLALGVYVAKGHRRALLLGSLGVVCGMFLLAVALSLGRAFYLNAVPTDVLPQDAAAALFDTLVRYLRNALRVTALAFVVIALGAFFTGGTATAVAARRTLARGIGWLRGGAESAGLRTGPVGSWVYTHKRWLWAALATLGVLTIFIAGQPSVQLILVTALLVLLAAAVVEFLGRPPRPDSGAAAHA